MAATATRSYREVQLVGEIIRIPKDSLASLPDQQRLYPFVRSEGESVGFVYEVTSHGFLQRVWVYDQVQDPGLARYLLDGRIRCSCDRRKDCRPRKCWHAELVRERKERERGER